MADPPRVPRPSSPEVDQVTRDYLLEQILAEQKHTNERLQRVETLYIDVLAVAQTGLALGSRVAKHARRIRMLERVVYEDQPRPDMHGPPEHRRPVIPAPSQSEAEDSGLWNLETLSKLKGLEEFRAREERRESFFYRKRWSILYAAIGSVAVVLLSTCVGVAAPRMVRALFPQSQPAKGAP